MGRIRELFGAFTGAEGRACGGESPGSPSPCDGEPLGTPPAPLAVMPHAHDPSPSAPLAVMPHAHDPSPSAPPSPALPPLARAPSLWESPLAAVSDLFRGASAPLASPSASPAPPSPSRTDCLPCRVSGVAVCSLGAAVMLSKARRAEGAGHRAIGFAMAGGFAALGIARALV